MPEVFSPSFLCVWNQMIWRNLQSTILLQDILQQLFRLFIRLCEFMMFCVYLLENYSDFPQNFLNFKFDKVEKQSIIYISIRRYPWCNGYRRRKWTRRHEFKSGTRMIAFSHSTNTLGKGMNPIIVLPAMGK